MTRQLDRFHLTDDHRRWARTRQRKYGGKTDDYLTLIHRQRGRCALSDVPLIFDTREGGGFVPGGPGCHPVYAALDHCAPGSDCHGFQIISYALNDLKGHLPVDCFAALCQSAAWLRLMQAWRRQHRRNASDREAFRGLLRKSETQRPRLPLLTNQRMTQRNRRAL
jgi:hypothetical protein